MRRLPKTRMSVPEMETVDTQYSVLWTLRVKRAHNLGTNQRYVTGIVRIPD